MIHAASEPPSAAACPSAAPGAAAGRPAAPGLPCPPSPGGAGAQRGDLCRCRAAPLPPHRRRRAGGWLADRPTGRPAATLGYTAETPKAGEVEDRSPRTYGMKTVLLTSRGFKSFNTKYLREKIVARGRKLYKRY